MAGTGGWRRSVRSWWWLVAGEGWWPVTTGREGSPPSPGRAGSGGEGAGAPVSEGAAAGTAGLHAQVPAAAHTHSHTNKQITCIGEFIKHLNIYVKKAIQ